MAVSGSPVSPLRPGEEVGWHWLVFESLCHTVLADIVNYEARHPDQDLPQPTVLTIMPLSRSAIPLCALIEEAFRNSERPAGWVQVSLPSNTRGESVPIVHCFRRRRTLHTPDQ